MKLNWTAATYLQNWPSVSSYPMTTFYAIMHPKFLTNNCINYPLVSLYIFELILSS